MGSARLAPVPRESGTFSTAPFFSGYISVTASNSPPKKVSIRKCQMLYKKVGFTVFPPPHQAHVFILMSGHVAVIETRNTRLYPLYTIKKNLTVCVLLKTWHWFSNFDTLSETRMHGITIFKQPPCCDILINLTRAGVLECGAQMRPAGGNLARSVLEASCGSGAVTVMTVDSGKTSVLGQRGRCSCAAPACLWAI